MSPWVSPACAMILFACLHVTTAAPNVQTSNLRVEFGKSAILPCNGSAYQGEEGTIHWETSLGEEVATLRIGEENSGLLYQAIENKPRFQLQSVEHLSRGDWSLVLHGIMLKDSGTYQCIWEGQRQAIVSTVWVTVNDPPFEDNVVIYEGESVLLKCFLRLSWSQTSSTLQPGWSKNGETLAYTEHQRIITSNDRFMIPGGPLEEFHLFIAPTQMVDNGEYRCWYKTGDLESPRPGLPDRIKLTVLKKHHEVTSDSWLSAFNVTTVVTTEEELTETTTANVIPVLLEDSAQPTKEVESQTVEALQETATSYPEEETTFEPSEWENLPWVRIGLIAGVLLVTAFSLCILKAQQKI